MTPLTILRFLEMPTGNRVYFHHQGVKLSLKNRSLLKLFIHNFFKARKTQLREIHIIFCTDQFLLALNRQHLGHNYYTDILTFNLSEKTDKKIAGEIYISMERVKENSKKFQSSFKSELLRVIFHGILHLSGFDDKTAGQKFTMRTAETELLTRFKQLEGST